MTVKEIMSTSVATCAPDNDVAMAIATMRDRDCGFLPVVDSHGSIVGVLTDRDICLAAADARRPVNRVSAREAMSAPAVCCLPDENVKVALATMAKHHVRRLPVIEKGGRLAGVLSMDDVVQGPQRRGGPTTDDIVSTLRAIYTRPPIALATH